jgi:hypothetical protein
MIWNKNRILNYKKRKIMRSYLMVLLLLTITTFSGCETMKQGTTAAGTVIGQGADVIGGVAEGAAEGYTGKDVTADNPYGR